MYPSLKEFRQFWQTCERITVYKEISGDMDTPVSMLSRLLSSDKALLLESAKQNKTYSRFSFLAFEVADKLVLRQDGIYRDDKRIGDVPLMNETVARKYEYRSSRGSVIFAAAMWAVSISSSWACAMC